MSLRESWEIRLKPSRVRVPVRVLMLLRASLPSIMNDSKPPILSWLHIPPSKVILISPPLSSKVFTALPENWLGLLWARPRPILITDGCCCWYGGIVLSDTSTSPCMFNALCFTVPSSSTPMLILLLYAKASGYGDVHGAVVTSITPPSTWIELLSSMPVMKAGWR